MVVAAGGSVDLSAPLGGAAKIAAGTLTVANRVGGDVDGQIANLSYFVTGRAWNEFDGETEGVIHNPGADLPFDDELTGAFGEAEAGLSLSNDANTLSGFLTSGVKWKDGYNAVNLSLGLRMAW